VRHIEAVTVADVGRVAAERLKPTRRTVGRFEPIR
jgi:predicted Zn-dependent peptidase